MAIRKLFHAFVFILFAGPALGVGQSAAAEPLLTVKGAIAGDHALDFDRAALEAMATETIRTTTPWTQGVQEFKGIPLQALMDHVGAKGDKLRAIALNDYAADVPIADSAEAGAIIAVRQNGETMSVRDKGPLWILFPYDADPKLTTDTYLNRSVWQLRTLEVR